MIQPSSQSEKRETKRMEDIGLNQNLAVGPREFHIQTATLTDEGVVRAEVFEKGRLLFVENYRYEKRHPNQEKGAETRLKRVVDQIHQTVIEEIDSLFETSEQVFEENNPLPHEKIGLVFLYMHIFDKAEKHFRRSIELDVSRFNSHLHLGRCFFLQKRYNQAREILDRLIRQEVCYPDLFNLLGLVMMETRDYWKALQYFKEALKRNSAYIEAYFNLSDSILRRVMAMKTSQKKSELKKSVDFIRIILKKIENFGNMDDRRQSSLINKTLNENNIEKSLNLIQEYRDKHYIRRVPPEIFGYQFYLRLFYSDEELSSETLENYEEKITAALQKNPSYPDLWHYLALIHLMQCRHYFLKGLDNFADATRINPNFDKAVKNLRLVENDGREFLSLIKTIV